MNLNDIMGVQTRHPDEVWVSKLGELGVWRLSIRCSADEVEVPDGWRRIETAQDSAVFGVWVNSCTKTIVNLCEGDALIEFASTAELFEARETIHKNFGG